MVGQNTRHSWKEEQKEGYKVIQICSKCGCLKNKGSIKLRMAIVGNKDYYKYESVWIYTTINGKTTKAPPCQNESLVKCGVNCDHDYGIANYGFQTCKKCGYTY